MLENVACKIGWALHRGAEETCNIPMVIILFCNGGRHRSVAGRIKTSNFMKGLGYEIDDQTTGTRVDLCKNIWARYGCRHRRARCDECLDKRQIYRNDKPLSTHQRREDEIHQHHMMLNGFITAKRRAAMLGKKARKANKNKEAEKATETECRKWGRGTRPQRSNPGFVTRAGSL